MKKYIGLLMLLVLSLSVWGCTNAAPQKDLNIKRTQVETETATIVKIDRKKRIVTIRDSEGKLFSVHARQEVGNLSQLQVGDIVVLDYIESVAVRMAKPGEVRDERREIPGKLQPGNTPGYVDATEMTVTATILDLDKVRMTATLKMPNGDVEVVRVQDPANMDKVKVGETIVITYTLADAVSIQKKNK